MTVILTWVKQIIMFYIFSSFVIHVLPNGKYEKYIKFFIGLILIAVVLNPITGIFNLDKVFNDIYNSAISNNSINDMKIDLQYAEESNYENIIEPYKEEIIKKVEEIIMEHHLFPISTIVNFDLNSGSKTFGQISELNIHVTKKYKSKNKIIVEKINIENSDVSMDSSSNNLSISSINIKNNLAEFYHISPSSINISE